MATRLTGPQKAAILLLSLGEEAAAEVLKNLSETEIVQVSRIMSRYQEFTPQDVTRVTNEFYLIAEKAHFLPTPPETKVEYLKKVLAKALGEEKAGQMLHGMVTGGSALERLKWHDPQTLADFLGPEHPQVIAVILANLGDPVLARKVLSALPPEVQEEVVPRFARLRNVPPEVVEEIEQSLNEITGSEGEGKPGGLGSQLVAGVVGSATAAVGQSLLGQLQRRDPALAEEVRSQIFPFEDFLKVDNYGMQKVLARSPGDDIVLALRLADDAIRQHFLSNLAPQAAAQIQQALDELGPTPVAAIEAAQKRLCHTARLLSDKGELFVLERKKPNVEPQPD